MLPSQESMVPMKKPAVIIASDDTALRHQVSRLLATQDCHVFDVHHAVDILPVALRQRATLIILGPWGDSTEDSLQIARQIRRADRTVSLIIIAVHSSEATAIAAIRAGVSDYFKTPLSGDQLAAGVARCLAGPPAPWPCRPPAQPRCPMIGDSPAMQQIKAYIGQVALTDSTVLVTGESGTGKELVAEMIHRRSARSPGPFIGINCAAIPDGLLESELFGHEKGAYTGANTAREGQFQLAQGGTIFLDEIGDMSPYAQAKILRAIETKTIYRLGGRRGIPVDVRIIAATNQDIEHCVSTGKFRSDLYFRLNVGRIHIPPLRERPEDLPALLEHYRGTMNGQFGLDVGCFHPEVYARLLRHHWPGNIREVKNLVEAMFINLISAPTTQLTLRDLPATFLRQQAAAGCETPSERERLLSALWQTNWNMSQAAQCLHWSRMTLYRKLHKYQIARSSPPQRATAVSRASPPSPTPVSAAIPPGAGRPPELIDQLNSRET
jgi:DNA-binding NtrC family response regulator